MHNVTMSKFTVEYKVFVDGVWVSGKVLRREQLASNAFDAVQEIVRLHQRDDGSDIELEFVGVSDAYTGSNPGHMELGMEYTTLEGNKVKMMKIHNAGSNFETMSDQFGVHRYSRRGCAGRCAGANSVCPMNIKLGLSWISRDFNYEEYEEKATGGRVSYVRGYGTNNYLEVENGFKFNYRDTEVIYNKLTEMFSVGKAMFSSKSDVCEFIDEKLGD